MKNDDAISIRCDTCKAKSTVAVPQAATKCKTCGAEGGILHHDPNLPSDARRTVCGKCAGDTNRRIVDRQNGTKQVDEDELYGRGGRR